MSNCVIVWHRIWFFIFHFRKPNYDMKSVNNTSKVSSHWNRNLDLSSNGVGDACSSIYYSIFGRSNVPIPLSYDGVMFLYLTMEIMFLHLDTMENCSSILWWSNITQSLDRVMFLHVYLMTNNIPLSHDGVMFLYLTRE